MTALRALLFSFKQFSFDQELSKVIFITSVSYTEKPFVIYKLQN